MAATFTTSGVGLTFGANKSLITLFNGTGSGRVLRVYRILMLNNQTVAIANGVIVACELRKISATSGGTSVTTLKHDTNSSDLNANITCTTGATDTVTDRYKMWYWSTDEPAATVSTIDEWQCLPNFNYIWDAVGDTNIDPIVLREGQGVTIKQPGSNTLGLCDIFIEFTDASS